MTGAKSTQPTQVTHVEVGLIDEDEAEEAVSELDISDMVCVGEFGSWIALLATEALLT